MEPVGRHGCDWLIILNRKAYYIKWRDVAPRPPWTRQVWDIFKLFPDRCGCPSAPVSLGWQWCWSDVIKTIRFDILQNWQNGDISGSGQTVVAIGTNVFQVATVLPQVAPVLFLDASDTDTVETVGGFVVRWSDKSGMFNDAVQTNVVNQPVPMAAGLNGLDTIRFDATRFLNLPTLKRIGSWHLFVVGRFFTNILNPRGTFLSAAGFESPFSGIEGKVYQDASIQPEGTPFTFLNPNDLPMVGTNLGSGIFGIWEYSELVSVEGVVKIGINAFDQQVFSGNTSEDFWDPTRQTFGENIPLPAAVGRSNWGVNPGQEFDFLDGEIGQIILYPQVLFEGQRIQVLNALRAKWNLGAPLPSP